MKLICSSVAYTYWRGDVGNGVSLVIFIIMLLVNIVCIIVSTIYKSIRKRLISKLFVVFFSGNVLVLLACIVSCCYRLTQRFNCKVVAAIYFFHQLGISISAVAIACTTVSYYRQLRRSTLETDEEHKKISQTLVGVQVVMFLVNSTFIGLPIVVDNQIAFIPSLAIVITLEIVIIRYSVKIRKTFQNLAIDEILTQSHTRMAKQSQKLVQPIAILTALFKINYILSNVVVRKTHNKIILWWSQMYYISFFLLPVFYLVKQMRDKIKFGKSKVQNISEA